MTAPSPARPPRRGLRMLVAAAAAVLFFAAAPTAASAETTPSPTPDAGDPSGVVSLVLSPVAGGVVRAGEGFAALVTVQNDTAGILPAQTAQVLVGDVPLSTRQEAAAWAAAPDDRVLQQAGAIALDVIASGDERTWSFVLTAADPLLAGRAPGVYPLLAVYGDHTAAATLVVAASTTALAPVAVLVPVTAPARTNGLISADELAAYTAVDGTLTQQLDGVEGTDAILAVDPAIAASIRVLGTNAPETATTWLARLEALPNSRFALQYGDADVAAQLHSSLGMLLDPLPFDAQLDPTAFAEPSPATSSPDPTAVPTTPTLEQLLDIGAAIPDVFWPATGSADETVVTALADEADAPLVLVPSTTTAGGADGATVPARGSGVLVYDSAISAALQSAAGIDDQVARSAVLSQVAAQLAFAVPQAAGAPLLVTLDRGEGRSRVALRAAIAAVTGGGGVAVQDLGDLLAAAPSAIEVSGGAPDSERAAAVDALVADEAALADFATVLTDPRLITAPERAAILQVLGDAWLADATAWRAALRDHHTEALTTLAAVSIPPPTDVNLLTANSRLQFTVRNALPWPVTVTLVAQPDDPRLRVQQATTVQASGDADTRVVVPVESRLGNGDVTIALALRSPTGVEIGTADSVDVRVRAEWEGVGIVVLTVLVGGLVVLGIARTVLRRRGRRARTATADPAADRSEASA